MRVELARAVAAATRACSAAGCPATAAQGQGHRRPGSCEVLRLQLQTTLQEPLLLIMQIKWTTLTRQGYAWYGIRSQVI